MNSKPKDNLIPAEDISDDRISETNAPPVEGYDHWFREQVQLAMDDRDDNGDQDYKPWRHVMAKFGF